MNQDSKYDDLLATRWIRELRPDEQAALERLFAEQASYRAQWEEDVAIIEGVDRLPDIPVSTNFTSQVMQSLARRVDGASEKPSEEKTIRWWARLGFVPRLGVGFALVLAVFGSFLQYKQGDSSKMAESLVLVTESETVPSLEELQHFEAIQMLAQVPVDVDWELITATE